MSHGYEALTDKEKDTLRLILGGHDAKSMASELDLSVHTVNERLRNARRKLAVTSSKEAARLLLQEEGDTPHSLGDKELGEASQSADEASSAASRAGMSPARLLGGLLIMMTVLAALALALQSGTADPPAQPSAAMQVETEAAAAALDWLERHDAGDWAATYAGTASSFREANTQQGWAEAAESVRAPLGAVLSRDLVAAEMLPTPEHYLQVQFRTDFANRAGVEEMLTLVHEDGAWRVVGIFME